MTGLKSAKSLISEDEEERDQQLKPPSLILISDDEDEDADADLSLKIVEKSMLRACPRYRPPTESEGGVEGGFTEEVLPDEEDDLKKKKKNNDKRTKSEEQDDFVDIKEGEEDTERGKSQEADTLVQENSEDKSDSLVLLKLLRGPRYFDPPDSNWGACYKCGECGHTPINCTSAKRRKPCFVCGSLEHNVKHCKKAKDCFICKKGSHRAKDCPEKSSIGSQKGKICLKCSHSGHDMFSCNNMYSPDDLKEVQCYVCKCFGHLCCVNYTGPGPKEVSCYRCGQLGHSGLNENVADYDYLPCCYITCMRYPWNKHIIHFLIEECGRLRADTNGMDTPSTCYRCGEEGHFARECAMLTKDWGRLYAETNGMDTPSSCYRCGEEGHFARECASLAKKTKRKSEHAAIKLNYSEKKNKSAPNDIRKARKRNRTHNEGHMSSSQPRHRGGWITEDPGDFSVGKYRDNGPRYPATPPYKTKKASNYGSGGSGGYNSNSSGYGKKTLHYGNSPYHGSSAYQHRYSASRFGNSSSRYGRREYDWQW